MSSGDLEKREELLGAFVREVRQFNGLGASFFRAAAGRTGLTVTDLQVIDILDVTGPTTAGQLAELTGLTTGAITGMLDRLEKAGLIRRERDPADGRRVIVRLIPSEEAMRTIGPLFESIGRGWDQITSRYDNEQLAFLLEFLKQSNTMSREEIARLRDTQEGEGRDFSAPLGGTGKRWLISFTGISQLALRADAGMAELYQAHFEGSVPNVKVEEQRVSIRYPQRLWLIGWHQGTAEVRLNVAVSWQIVIQGGASIITAELGGVDLAGLEVKGGMSQIRLGLPVPSSVVPIRIGGGASDITVQRPAGVAARVHFKGWASAFIFDDQRFSNVGNDVRLQSPGYDDAAQRYDIEVNGSASMVTVGISG